jgi:hypothetical protein
LPRISARVGESRPALFCALSFGTTVRATTLARLLSRVVDGREQLA